MISVVFWVSIFLGTVIVHEVCHGLVAYKCGDPTARDAGRLTLNPLKHIDLFWTVLFPALLFFSTGGRFAIGMAKPVPVNFYRLRNYRRDMILVAAAGPASNLLLATGLNIFWHLTQNVYFLYAIYFNLGVAMFNLIPIPPLDGSRIVTALLPNDWAQRYLSIERFGFVIVFLLYVAGILWRVIIPCVNFFCRVLDVPTLVEFLLHAQSYHGG